LNPGTLLVEARGLRKSYGPRVVLDGLDLAAHAGEVVGLLGPNGAGKSTTLGILATHLKPDSGDIRIAGIDCRVQASTVRRFLGFVPQRIALYPSLSGIRNIELFARMHGLDRRTARKRALRMLEEVGLSERSRDPVETLSGGMQRRLNLACGLVHHPSVVLLDEPTVGIDPQSRENILEIVRKIAIENHVAVIYSTHYMEEVERLCNRVLLIDHGKVVASGTVNGVIALAGGHPRIEITFRRPPASGWMDGLSTITDITAVNDLATNVEPDCVVLALADPADTGRIFERANASGGEVLEFNVHAPNLSDAFIALTGHALRDSGRPRH
jgi:ABC-2 type transport system ATP-binding protein